MAKNTDFSSLIRQAGQDIKRDVQHKSAASSEGIFDILSYIESDWGLQMRLFPAQRAIVKLYYFLELDDTLPEDPLYRIHIRDFLTGDVRYTFTEKEYLKYLFNEGRCNIGEQDHVRRQLLLAIGRRGGKTELSSIFASYEVYRLLNLYNPQQYYGLPNGNRIQIISVGIDKEQAGILFNNVAGHLAKCDYFHPYQANNTQSQVNFRTPYDIEKYGSTYREHGKFTSFNGKASLRLTFKGSNGKGLRGPGNIVIILDEFAHFLDHGPTSADEIYDAITPSAATFAPKDPDRPMVPTGDPESRIICISSPMGKSGKFYRLYDQAMRNDRGSKNMLAIQAPTWEINPTVPVSYLQEKYYAGPVAFSTEFGANFNDQVSGWIEREVDLLACIDLDHRPLYQARPRVPHNLGLDLGLIGDGTYIAITHVENNQIVLDYHEGWYAGVDWKETNPHLKGQYSTDYAKTLAQLERLDFDAIGDWIRVICKRFQIRSGLFDRWNGIPLEQNLHKTGLKQIQCEHFTRDQTSKIFQAVKMMIYDERLKLYDFPIPERIEESGGSSRHAPYIAELLSLRAKHLSKNIVLVEAPKKDGAHDDFSHALARSVWLSIEQLTSEKYATHGVGAGMLRPHATGTSSLSAFQIRKARLHGPSPRARLTSRNVRYVR